MNAFGIVMVSASVWNCNGFRFRFSIVEDAECGGELSNGVRFRFSIVENAECGGETLAHTHSRCRSRWRCAGVA